MELSNKTASYNVKKKKNTDLEKYFFNDSFNFLLSVFWENILIFKWEHLLVEQAIFCHRKKKSSQGVNSYFYPGVVTPQLMLTSFLYPDSTADNKV